MRLTTILNPFYPMSLRERRERLAEWAWGTAGRHLPKRLAYWSMISTGVRNIRDDEEVPAVPFTVVLQRAGEAIR